MSPEFVFITSSIIAAIGWIILVLLGPFWYRADRYVTGIIMVLLIFLYLWLLLSHFEIDLIKQMTTLDGFAGIFENKYFAAAGWVHYLCIDLLAGAWIRKNAFKHGVHQWLTVGCLLLTMAAAPVGIIIYLIIRTLKTKEYLSENF